MNSPLRSGHGCRGLLLLSLAGLAACVAIPSETTLRAAVPQAGPACLSARIGSVQILDPSVANRSPVEDSLRASLANFLREARSFIEVDGPPDARRGEEVILDFRFDRYHLARTIHPAYVPAAILTLTLYTWFGGPIYRDASDLSGTLAVKNADGLLLAESHAHVTQTRAVSLRSPGYPSFDGSEPRTLLVQELVEKAVQSVNDQVRWHEKSGCGQPET